MDEKHVATLSLIYIALTASAALFCLYEELYVAFTCFAVLGAARVSRLFVELDLTPKN